MYGKADSIALKSTLTATTRPDGAFLELVRRCGILLIDHPRVVINADRLSSLVAKVAEQARIKKAAYQWNDPKFWPIETDASTRSQLLTVGNSINFRFWRFSESREVVSLGGYLKGEYVAGSMYMWRCLRLAYDSGTPITDASYLAAMDDGTFNHIFQDDNGANPLQEALPDRIKNLRNLGEVLIHDWDGQFHNLVTKTSGSLSNFLHMSRGFRAFDDPIAKLTLVNALMHRGSGLAVFKEPLLPAIDYQLLKQLLRQHVLTVDSALDAKIRSDVHLDHAEAYELRSAAMEALIGVQSRTGLSGDIIDNLLWMNRNICKDRQPNCEICPFMSFCDKDVTLRRPLQITRHY
ncbi:queuosine salvage family protein [Gordonia sp. NPDC062954]|uniref:queuosine salvage family protein n=1 Tax=Gordonia sp. NPDC062954 TaxID=3364003 RepID=UPI0037C8B995